MLNVQLMSISHTVINAALARQQGPVTALAAFSAAMVLHLFVASPSYQNHIITITLVRGRRSLLGVILFVLFVAFYVATVLALIAFTPLGNSVLRQFLGVRGEVAEGVRSVLGILVLLPFLTGFRGLFQGLVIRARRTGLVSLATLVRIASLLGFLALGARWFAGPALGAFGLVGCIAVETVLVGYFAWRHRLPPTAEVEKGAGDIFRFGLPLAFSSALQQAVPLLVAAIVSRLPDGELALAAYGVIRGLLFLLAGPMRNLQQAYLTLVRDRTDYAVLVIFFRRVAAGMALLMVLIAYPLNAPVLGWIMGLAEPMRRYIVLPLACCALFPIFYGASHLFRGYFAGEHRTGILSRSTIYKVLYLLLCWWGITAVPPGVPGIALAVFLLISAEFWEVYYLRYRRDLLQAA